MRLSIYWQWLNVIIFISLSILNTIQANINIYSKVIKNTPLLKNIDISSLNNVELNLASQFFSGLGKDYGFLEQKSDVSCLFTIEYPEYVLCIYFKPFWKYGKHVQSLQLEEKLIWLSQYIENLLIYTISIILHWWEDRHRHLSKF